MPRRVYRCPQCGDLVEVLEKWDDVGKHMCVHCEMPMKRIYQVPSILMEPVKE